MTTRRKQRILQNRPQIRPILSPFIRAVLLCAALSEMLWYQNAAVREQIVMSEVAAS